MFHQREKTQQCVMTEINDLINKIIPPADYEHRNGFSNDNIIDKLTADEKVQVEMLLFARLNNYNGDTLIIETLTYMNSQKSLDTFNKILSQSDNPADKIIIASCIYKLSKDKLMGVIALESVKRITDKYALISMFYYLAQIESKELDDYIKQYSNHSDYLLSYNAKRILGHKA